MNRKKKIDQDNNNVNRTEGYAESGCPICLECVDTSKAITLQCGHKFHKDCLYKWDRAQLEGKALTVVAPLNDLRNHPNDTIHMLVHLDESGVILCPCCRTEYIITGSTDNDGDIIPKKILGRIYFAEIDGFRPIHYVVDFAQLTLYMHKHVVRVDEVYLKMWAILQEHLIDDMKSGECTDLEVFECTCSSTDCPRVFVVNEKLLDHIPFCSRARPMSVSVLRNYVADIKTIKQNIKLLRNLM